MISKPARKTPSGKDIGPTQRAISVLGAPGVGKSSLIHRFISSDFSESYNPTIIETFEKTLSVKGINYALEIYDTRGLGEHSTVDRKPLESVHGWVLVYAIDDSKSFERMHSIRDKILSFKGFDTVPLVLVGNKTDLEGKQRAVSKEDGQKLAKEWNCAWTESSAKDDTNVDHIFTLMVKEVEKEMNPPPVPDENKNNGCVVS